MKSRKAKNQFEKFLLKKDEIKSLLEMGEGLKEVSKCFDIDPTSLCRFIKDDRELKKIPIRKGKKPISFSDDQLLEVIELFKSGYGFIGSSRIVGVCDSVLKREVDKRIDNPNSDDDQISKELAELRPTNFRKPTNRFTAQEVKEIKSGLKLGIPLVIIAQGLCQRSWTWFRKNIENHEELMDEIRAQGYKLLRNSSGRLEELMNGENVNHATQLNALKHFEATRLGLTPIEVIRHQISLNELSEDGETNLNHLSSKDLDAIVRGENV